jgi:hypothetical protein
MARQVQSFAVTVPAGTLNTAPATFDVSFPPRVVTEIEVLVPPGPRGEVGFQVAMAGKQVIPDTEGAFIVTDDEVIHWPLDGQPDSGAWQVIAYNTGTYNHTLYFRFLVDLTQQAPDSTPPAFVESVALSQ